MPKWISFKGVMMRVGKNEVTVSHVINFDHVRDVRYTHGSGCVTIDQDISYEFDTQENAEHFYDQLLLMLKKDAPSAWPGDAK